MVNEIIFPEYVLLGMEALNRNDALMQISKFALERGIVDDVNGYYEGLLERENISTTGLGYGIAIPHAKVNAVKKSALMVIKFKNNIDWDSLDDEPVNLALVIAMQGDNMNNDHLVVLAHLARKIMHEEFREKLMKAKEPLQFIELIKE